MKKPIDREHFQAEKLILFKGMRPKMVGEKLQVKRRLSCIFCGQDVTGNSKRVKISIETAFPDNSVLLSGFSTCMGCSESLFNTIMCHKHEGDNIHKRQGFSREVWDE